MNRAQAEQLFRQAGAPLPEFMEAPKVSKYRAIRKEVNGIIFDSSLEARAYQILCQWATAGEISGLELQPEFLLQAGYRDNDGKWRRPIKYRADFRFRDGDKKRLTVVDVKGFVNATFAIKVKLLLASHPDIDFQVWNREKVRSLSK